MPESNDPMSMNPSPIPQQQNVDQEAPQADVVEPTQPEAQAIPQQPEAQAAAQQQPEQATPQQPEAQQATPQQPEAQPQPVAQQAYQQAPYSAPQQEVKDTAPLVLGILSIVFAGVIGLILSIVGMSKSKKVLAIAPNSGKAKGGRICSIVGLIFSIIAIVSVIALFALGIGIFSSDVAQATQTADATLKEVVNPDAAEREDFVSSFETGMGVSLSSLGISGDEFSTWLFDSNSYSITDVKTNSTSGKTTATVTAKVKARSLVDMEKNLENMDTSKFSTATSVDQYYKILGDAMKDAMNQTQPSEKTVTVTLTKTNGTWTTDSGVAENIATSIYTK